MAYMYMSWRTCVLRCAPARYSYGIYSHGLWCAQTCAARFLYARLLDRDLVMAYIVMAYIVTAHARLLDRDFRHFLLSVGVLLQRLRHRFQGRCLGDRLRCDTYEQVKTRM